MKEQMDRTVAGYDKKISDILNDRHLLLYENDNLQSKLSSMSRQIWTAEKDVDSLQKGYKMSIDELQKMDKDHEVDINN